MKTTVHAYRFDISKPDQKAAWEALRDSLKATHPSCMESWGPKRESTHYLPDLDGVEVTLETAHLFDNQWNTAPVPGVSAKGLRLFDWALDAPPSLGDKHIRQGHYLDQTPEMREARRNTNVCGYCGHQEAAARGAVFCPKCPGSPYLKESELHLLRMLPVDRSGPGAKRAPLTDAEHAYLMPIYREAQKTGTGERSDAYRTAKRAAVIAKAAKATASAETERDGMLWLMDHGVSLENVIFYSHTGRFCFGWRSKLSPGQLSVLLEALGAEFPFSYDIETADGRKLSAER